MGFFNVLCTYLLVSFFVRYTFFLIFLWLGRFWFVVPLECLVEGAFYDEART